MKIEINKDLSVLTTISEPTFEKLDNKIIWCISDAIEKSMYDREETTEIDLGFGKLFINTSNTEIRYKFMPSKELEEAVKNTVINERNDLALNIEDSLIHKMTSVFKDFF